MDRLNSAALSNPAVETPRTAEATFTITPLDVGTKAVRPGHMADMEQQRDVLLIAAKLALKQIQGSGIRIGGQFEFALAAAIQIAEAPR